MRRRASLHPIIRAEPKGATAPSWAIGKLGLNHTDVRHEEHDRRGNLSSLTASARRPGRQAASSWPAESREQAGDGQGSASAPARGGALIRDDEPGEPAALPAGQDIRDVFCDVAQRELRAAARVKRTAIRSASSPSASAPSGNDPGEPAIVRRTCVADSPCRCAGLLHRPSATVLRHGAGRASGPG